MQFTKEQAVERISAKFTDNDKAKSIDLTRTIDEAVSNGIAMLGEESKIELDAFVGFIEKNVSSALGLARHERSKFSSDLQKELDELKSKQSKTDKPEPNNDDSELQRMRQEIEEMRNKMKARETEELISEKRSKLISKMEESIKDKEWIREYLSEINVTTETDVEAKAKDYVAFYNKTQAKSSRYTPRQTGDNDDDNANVKSVIASAANFKKNMTAISGSSPVVTSKQD